ncbi:hypothetical protein SMUE_04880 [Enterococcus cecorum]
MSETFQFFTNQVNNIDVLHLIVSAYVVDFTYASFVDDKVDGLAVIFYIELVANIQAFSVDWERLAI